MVKLNTFLKVGGTFKLELNAYFYAFFGVKTIVMAGLGPLQGGIFGVEENRSWKCHIIRLQKWQCIYP